MTCIRCTEGIPRWECVTGGLWCDGRPSDTSDGSAAQKRKRDCGSSTTGTSRQDKDEVDSVYKELHAEKHGSKYDCPRLRLWSRILTSGLHEDCENPDIPAFLGTTPKRPREESVSDVITVATAAFAEAICGKNKK